MAINAAPTVKRVTQELGGKSANILLDDVNLNDAVTRGVNTCFANSGQSCSSPTRMLVPRRLMDEAAHIAARAAQAFRGLLEIVDHLLDLHAQVLLLLQQVLLLFLFELRSL